ncbi:helix-hairpin-helix domain-containing protein, partial [Klebsiella pneumoniae]|uniref:helix-hairpin-helix domain-containing protein n=1 Tax=Klebsiella pneumoniae TaxID=573 RepID=UPI002FC290C4
MYLVQRVRDEAHRFANSGHRQRRSKVGTASLLDEIGGVGPKRRKVLLEKFGSLEGIRRASLEDLVAVGVPVEV